MPIKLILLTAFILIHNSAVWADCSVLDFGKPRNSDAYRAQANECSSEGRWEGSGSAASALGYMYRNGYGVHRDLDKARMFFESALTFERCESYAVCGLRRLSNSEQLPDCDVNCSTLGTSALGQEAGATPISAVERARRLLAELISDGQVKQEAEELQLALRDILAEEKRKQDIAFEELCTGHIRRGVVSVSLAYHLEHGMRRRMKLIDYHGNKLAEGQNASSEAAIQKLYRSMFQSATDKQVFFEKYTQAVFSAKGCGQQILERSFRRFEEDIADASVSELEQTAFTLFKSHIKQVQNNEGVGSDWFQDLSALID